MPHAAPFAPTTAVHGSPVGCHAAPGLRCHRRSVALVELQSSSTAVTSCVLCARIGVGATAIGGAGFGGGGGGSLVPPRLHATTRTSGSHFIPTCLTCAGSVAGRGTQ